MYLCISLITLTCLFVQIIQRQLEQVEEKQRQLEERGVAVEKALRGEAGKDSSPTPSDICFLDESGHLPRRGVSVMLLQIDECPH